MRSAPPLLLAVLSALSAGCGADTPAPRATIELEDCRLRGTAGLSSIAAQCGTLSVPENPAAPDGRRIDLHVARVRALSLDPPDDALTVLAGGPGQAATEFYADYAGAFEAVRRRRDILLVDQRGTGRSNALECPAQEALDDDDLSPEAIRAATAECLAGLDGDPRFYTTSVAVADLELARAALGYQTLDLYGISYGTRVAQHYLRRFPARTRTVILDGVVPMDLALGPDISPDAQAALDNLFARCTAEPDCAKHFPDLDAAFDSIRSLLARSPVPVSLAHPVTAMPLDTEFSAQDLAIAVRLLSYTSETMSLLPLLLHHAYHERDFAPLAAQVQMVTERLTQSLSHGMHNAIVCTEDVPFYDPSQIDRAALEATYLGAAQLDALVEICRLWPAGVIDDDFKSPVASGKPVLLLSGAADPVTPPVNAQRVRRHLDNALDIVAAGQGHGVAAAGCIPRLMARFIEQGSIAGIDRACVADIRPAPFFTGFTGPAP
jgi:pimeloyl-ACP methyl ester carboxylesterase